MKRSSKKRARLAGAARFGYGAAAYAYGAQMYKIAGNHPIRMVAKNTVPGLIRRGAVLAGRYSRPDLIAAGSAMALGGLVAAGGVRQMYKGAKQMITGRGGARRSQKGHRFYGNQYSKVGAGVRRAGRAIGRGYISSVRQKFGRQGVRNVRASVRQKYGRRTR
jgi:hypothetical protein